VHRERAGRILVNGAAATQALLADLGNLWLDIHGPREAQTLFSERRQLELLDAFAKDGTPLPLMWKATRNGANSCGKPRS
jgi:DNA repair protein RecN (Recombination protein N)